MRDIAALPIDGTTLLGQNDLTSSFLSNNVTSLDSNSSLLGVLNTIRSTASQSAYRNALRHSTLNAEIDTANENSNSGSQFNQTLDQPRHSTSITLDRPSLLAQSTAFRLTTNSNIGVANTDTLTGTAANTVLVGDSTQEVKINFQPDTSDVPAGYVKDIGEAYSEARGFGWVRQDSLSGATPVPLNITRNSRDRNQTGLDPRLNTLILMQASRGAGVSTPAAWEYALPNGRYDVTVSVGDSAFYDSQHSINVEGINTINRFQPSSAQAFVLTTTQVEVMDGKLTIDAIRGTNTKINYLDIAKISPSQLGRIEVSTPNPTIAPNRMVFGTFNEESRLPQILTLRNTGTGPLTITNLSFGNSQEQDNVVRLADHRREADFKFVNGPTLPLVIQPGESVDLPVEFLPQRVARNSTDSITDTLNGENYSSLTITSDDPTQPTRVVNLAGLNFANYEGNNEPSLAEIARTFGWTTNIGSEKQILGGSKPPDGLLGDEVYSPYWLRADTNQPVYLWPLAVTSGRGSTPHGQVKYQLKGGGSRLLYGFAGRDNDDNLPGSNYLSGGENQKLLPKILVNVNGTLTNVTPTADNVDFIPTKSFALSNGGASTDDTQNGPGQLHNWRMYPVQDAQGALIPNTWYATHDIGNREGGFKNYDYNDHVYLLVNAKPESAS